ncbi:MAG: hypothetical protein PHU42_00930 [Patescibacteria group bacterium]|nr:hypothetical protein [Patescibacteria group bacterium]
MDNKITIEQLKKPEFLESAKKRLDDILNYDSGKEARDFAYDLEKVLKENPDFEKASPDLYNQYQDLIVKLKLVGLQFLKDEEIVPVLKDHFSIMLLSFPPVTNDIVDKLRAHLVGIPVYEERDTLKGEIMKILVESQETITTNNLRDENGIGQPPTIANWIKDYLRETQGPEDESLKLIMYLTNARGKMNLSDKEADALKSFLSLYEFLRHSSLTPEGLEESVLFSEDGLLKILRQGQVEVIGPAGG